MLSRLLKIGLRPLLDKRVVHKSKRTFLKPTYMIHSKFSQYGDKTAIVDKDGYHSYHQLDTKSDILKEKLKLLLPEKSPKQIALLLPNSASYVISQLAIWKAGHAAVPLHSKHPPSQLEYYLEDSQSQVLITIEEMIPKLEKVDFKKQILVLDKSVINAEVNTWDSKPYFEPVRKQTMKSNALIIYTSGTTGPPKGVVLTHANLDAQVRGLVSSWEITNTDVLLHCLPLNHIHGVINALMCPLYSGGTVIMESEFNAGTIWDKFLTDPVSDEIRPNLFMAVPTIYAKLIAEHHQRFGGQKITYEYVRRICLEQFRLMVSGSAPLLPEVLKQWQEITGHILLERYGMTEIGMALSNPLRGKRRPGFVGCPLPKVKVFIGEGLNKQQINHICEADEYQTIAKDSNIGKAGELYVKGPSVFKEYFNKPEATKQAFKGGWFQTGDTACFENGSFKILGRTSTDIIKSGGFKISALDVEAQVIKHPHISDVAVVGVPDFTWGEKVAAAIVWNGKHDFDLKEFRKWAADHLPSYQIPSEVKVLPDGVPRNHMGKVNKKQLILEEFPTKIT